MSQPALTPAEFSSAVTAITSAFGDPTRREIFLFVHEHSGPSAPAAAGVGPEVTATEVTATEVTATGVTATGVTATEVADHFVLHPNVARHHLDKLASGGYVEVTATRTGGGAGRPSKRYRVTTPDVALELPVRHDELLVTLLGKALSVLPSEQAESMAEEVGREYGRSMAAAMGGVDHSAGTPGAVQKSVRTALQAVADALTAHGFDARAEHHSDGLRIVSDHCPFGTTALDHPVLCAVDRGLVRGLLGAIYGQADTTMSETRPTGGARCVTSVTL